MPYFASEQIEVSLVAYEETTHTMLIPLLAMWRMNFPLDDGEHYAPFGSEQETSLLEDYFAPTGGPESSPLFIPFYKTQGKSRWRALTYAQKSLQAQRSRLPDIFVKKPQSRKEWALHRDYVANALRNPDRSIGIPPISIPALATWTYRDVDLKSLAEATERFVAEFRLDRDGLIGNDLNPSIFTREDRYDIGEPQEVTPITTTDLLSVLARRSPAPERSSAPPLVVGDEEEASGGLVDPDAFEGSWDFDVGLLNGIGGLDGMEEAAFSAAAALRAGDHVIFIGPPGTGKTTLAEALCKAAGLPSTLATATESWTTFETIGSYFQTPGNALERGEKIDFLPGLMLDAIIAGRCLVIDELNRADMDKCFGEFFSIATGQSVTLPFRKLTDAGFERIRLMPKPGIVEKDVHPIPVPSWWRLIGAMNDADKGAVRRLSQAFKRRFACIPVSLPPRDTYVRILRSGVERSNAPTTAPMDRLLEVLEELFATEGNGFGDLGQPMGPAIPLTIIRRAVSEWSLDEKRPLGRVLNSLLANAVAPLLSEANIDRSQLLRVVGPHVEDVDRFIAALAMWNSRTG